MQRYSIVIPSKKKNSAPVSRPDRRKAMSKVVDLLTETYGGVTCIDGEGTYRTDKGHLITEKITEVITWTDADARGQLILLANHLKETLDQESILITCNHKGELR